MEKVGERIEVGYMGVVTLIVVNQPVPVGEPSCVGELALVNQLPPVGKPSSVGKSTPVSK